MLHPNTQNSNRVRGFARTRLRLSQSAQMLWDVTVWRAGQGWLYFSWAAKCLATG